MVIVGTHIDKIRRFGDKLRETFTRSIKFMYSNEHKYPPIKAIKFVSCQEKFESYMKDLRDTLYDIASETKLTLSKLTF